MEKEKILHDRMKEELHDVITYGEIYEEMKAAGMHHDAEIIEDIARDEYDHAHALCKMIHHEMDEEADALWKEARAAFEEEE